VVDGCAVLPGVVEFGEVEPGDVVFGAPLDPGVVDPDLVDPGVAPGLVVCPGVVCGVAVPAGGVAVLAGGVAGEPGVEFCPALLPAPPAGAAPAGAPWATAQLAQHNTTDSKVSFRDDISLIPPGVEVPAPKPVFRLNVTVELEISCNYEYAHSEVGETSGVCLRYAVKILRVGESRRYAALRCLRERKCEISRKV